MTKQEIFDKLRALEDDIVYLNQSKAFHLRNGPSGSSAYDNPYAKAIKVVIKSIRQDYEESVNKHFDNAIAAKKQEIADFKAETLKYL